jgi:hypothetical protein
MLIQLQKEFKDNEIGESLLDNSLMPDNMLKMDGAIDKFEYSEIRSAMNENSRLS